MVFWRSRYIQPSSGPNVCTATPLCKWQDWRIPHVRFWLLSILIVQIRENPENASIYSTWALPLVQGEGVRSTLLQRLASIDGMKHQNIQEIIKKMRNPGIHQKSSKNNDLQNEPEHMETSWGIEGDRGWHLTARDLIRLDYKKSKFEYFQ